VSLALFVIVYAVVFSAGIYFINRLIERGPAGAATGHDEPRSPLSPASAARRAGQEAAAQG
jgi:cytochrome d ubiquinol oxidase subunit I